MRQSTMLHVIMVAKFDAVCRKQVQYADFLGVLLMLLSTQIMFPI